MSEFAPREAPATEGRSLTSESVQVDPAGLAAEAQAAGGHGPMSPAELQSAELLMLSGIEPAMCVAPESLPAAVDPALLGALTGREVGRPVHRWARVAEVKPWLTLRRDRDARPIDRQAPQADPLVEALLRFNDRVLILNAFAGNWVEVRTDDGHAGFVDRNYLIADPPEPHAQLYRTQSGDTALSIAQAHYDCGEWGADGRFFVNVLALVNQGEGDPQKGLFKRDAAADWDATEVRAGYWIWLPSPAFAHGLRGQVDSGSLTHAIFDVAVAATAFEVGWFKGSLEGMTDAVTGLVDGVRLLWDILEKAFRGTLVFPAGKPFVEDREMWRAYEEFQVFLRGG